MLKIEENKKNQMVKKIQSLQKIYFGSSAIPSQVVTDCIKIFSTIEFIHLYGTTEAGIITVLSHSDYLKFMATNPHRLRSVGKPLDWVQVKLYDENKKEAPIWPSNGISSPPTKGYEILVRGLYVFKTYYKNEKVTLENFYDDYYKTGDLGYLDEEGYLYLNGRKKEYIKTLNAEHIVPVFVDETIAAYGEGNIIKDCISLGIPVQYYDLDYPDLLITYLETFVILYPQFKKTAEEILQYFMNETRGNITLSRVHIVQTFSGIMGGTNKPVPDMIRERYSEYLKTLPLEQRRIDQKITVPLHLLEKK